MKNKNKMVQKYKIRASAGFTMVELLISLTISALLLAAVAFAFNGSVINFRQNEDIFKSINSARQALFRITTQLRTANAVEPSSPANRCSFITAANQNLTYEYRNITNCLYLIDNGTNQEYLLCDHVSAMNFIKNPTVDGLDCKSVQISMTVGIGGVQRTFSTAAVIRRNLD
jgi:prepilin-type N-terminal cleavage/methylation domain-containing protein